MKTHRPPHGLPSLGAAVRHTTLDYAPLVLTRMPARLTDDDVELIISGFDALYAAEVTFASVLDAREMLAAPTPKQRKRLTEWAAAAVPLTKKYGVCTTYVITSALVRASLTAISWVFDHPTPMKYVGTMGEAADFAGKHLTARGLALPPNVDEFRRLPPLSGG